MMGWRDWVVMIIGIVLLLAVLDLNAATLESINARP